MVLLFASIVQNSWPVIKNAIGGPGRGCCAGHPGGCSGSPGDNSGNTCSGVARGADESVCGAEVQKRTMVAAVRALRLEFTEKNEKEEKNEK